MATIRLGASSTCEVQERRGVEGLLFPDRQQVRAILMACSINLLMILFVRMGGEIAIAVIIVSEQLVTRWKNTHTWSIRDDYRKIFA